MPAANFVILTTFERDFRRWKRWQK